jgi:hypothetical protein
MALLGGGFAEEFEPPWEEACVNRAMLQMSRHKILSIVPAAQARRREPELDYALYVGIPVGTDCLFEYRSQQVIAIFS